MHQEATLKLHILHPTWIRLSVVLWIASSLIYGLLLGSELKTGRAIYQPLGWWVPVGMFVPSIATGLLVAIVWHRTLPSNCLLLPSRARILGAIGYWFVFPIGAINLLPSTAGFLAYFSFAMLSERSWVIWPDFLAGWFNLLLVFFPISYVISCLLCHGIPRWSQRMLAFVLIWCGQMAIIAAIGNVSRGFL